MAAKDVKFGREAREGIVRGGDFHPPGACRIDRHVDVRKGSGNLLRAALRHIVMARYGRS